MPLAQSPRVKALSLVIDTPGRLTSTTVAAAVKVRM
jgi:hypothetical protein